MTERILGEDVVGAEALAACADAVSELLQVVPDEVVKATRKVVLVAGTATTRPQSSKEATTATPSTAPASRARSCARRSVAWRP